ncbi:MAG: hypothetical protein WC332_00420 [Clostridia bacterium]|jgi:hypothetical protein
MIIKFQENEKWVIFSEVDHVEYEPVVTGNNVGYGGGIICYNPPNNKKPANECFELSFFTKNMTEATVIHAYSPIYLMNDNGKTIETI